MNAEIRELTIIMSVRIDSEIRLNNIYTTLKYYQKTSVPIIVVEADTKSHLENMMKAEFSNIEHVFVKDDRAILHRTHYMNEGFRRVKTQNAANIDADIILPINQLIKANNALLDENLIMAIPYDGRCVGLNENLSDHFREKMDCDLLPTYCNEGLMFGHWSVGGAYLVNVRRYQEMGWENENFIGWGPEDIERVHRLDILGFKPLKIHGKIYHLHHPRGINSGNGNLQIAYSTKKEYCKVCSMLPDELKEYVSTWKWNT